MRILLIIIVILGSAVNLSAQSDFITLDKKTYDYYLKGDYPNLRKTANTMISKGMDYYYLRMRVGITSFNNELYYSALGNFTKALEFNSLDTVSRQYIFNTYLFSGRKADAYLYLGSLRPEQKNSFLKSVKSPPSSEFYFGSSYSGFSSYEHASDNYYQEVLKNNFGLTFGIESYFSSKWKGNFSYTNFRKAGTFFSSSIPLGADLNFTQNQLYTRISRSFFSGWEISGFGHFAFFSGTNIIPQSFSSSIFDQNRTSFLGGLGVTKSGWRIRAGANVSYSNFGLSNQLRGEANLTWLPSGNLNLYLTSGWMGQSDRNWGGTYQVNQEIGFKVFKYLWMEAGIVHGNSFLFARNQGYLLNNSFIVPETTLYGNIIIQPGKRISIILTPFYSKNQNYSWDLNTYSRGNEQIVNSFGGSLKIIIKNR